MQKRKEKKITSVSFMYVCVAGNGEMLVFFPFFPNNNLNRQLSFRVEVCMYVCMCKAKLTFVSFFPFFLHLSLCKTDTIKQNKAIKDGDIAL